MKFVLPAIEFQVDWCQPGLDRAVQLFNFFSRNISTVQEPSTSATCAVLSVKKKRQINAQLCIVGPALYYWWCKKLFQVPGTLCTLVHKAKHICAHCAVMCNSVTVYCSSVSVVPYKTLLLGDIYTKQWYLMVSYL